MPVSPHLHRIALAAAPVLALALALTLSSGLAGAQTVQRGSGTAGAPDVRTALALPLPAATVSSRFGLRKHPILGVTMMHEGVDLAAPTGTPIAAAAAGTVVESGHAGGYGNLVRVAHADGLETVYGHMSRLAVAAGSAVAAGDILGYVGSTGLANGPHLHFEVRRDGKPVDPMGSGVSPALARVRQAIRHHVEVLRGGTAPTPAGGPKASSAAGVQVVRGGRR